MVDFSTELGQRISQRLRQEELIWLTTVDPGRRPQPRPVWFHWDGTDVLIFSQPGAAKIRHIQNNPAVALNFNTNTGGGDVAVMIGEAQILASELPEARLQAYLEKYEAGIKDIGMTPDQMVAEYSAIILVTPHSLRGF
jgi:PPOX class probable F420-dependent enzyme